VAIDMWTPGEESQTSTTSSRSRPTTSPADVAIREAERLINMEKLPVILGFTPAPSPLLWPHLLKEQDFFWITIAIADTW